MLVLEKELVLERKITNAVLRSFLYILKKAGLERKCGKTNRGGPGSFIIPGERHAETYAALPWRQRSIIVALLKWHLLPYKVIYWDFKAVAIACSTGCTQLIM